MLDFALTRVLLRVLPGIVPGGSLHRRALAAVAAGRAADADHWFEAAADAYRRELAIEPLARLRVHQAMARARASADETGEGERLLEIVRGLNRLDALESFEPPHPLIDAREVLAAWVAADPVARARPVVANGAANTRLAA